MRRFTDAGRRAIADRNYYAALSMALTMPDICASLEDPGPGKSQKRYVRWCKKWVESKFTAELGMDRQPHTFVSADDCYQLRCSLIHSGSAEIDAPKRQQLHRFAFFDDSTGAHLNWFGEIVLNGVSQGGFLQLKAGEFSETMFAAAEEWDISVAGVAEVQAEKAKLLVIHSRGATLYGVRFD